MLTPCSAVRIARCPPNNSGAILLQLANSVIVPDFIPLSFPGLLADESGLHPLAARWRNLGQATRSRKRSAALSSGGSARGKRELAPGNVRYGISERLSCRYRNQAKIAVFAQNERDPGLRMFPAPTGPIRLLEVSPHAIIWTKVISDC
jgi:hypothetical protein